MSEDPRDDVPEEDTPQQPEDEDRAVGPEIEGMAELAASAAEEPAAEEPAAEEEPAPAEEQPTAEEPAAEEPAAEAEEPAPAAEGEAAEEPAAEGEAGDEAPRERRPKREKSDKDDGGDEVIPGMHLEPDLVLEEPPREESEFGAYASEPEAAEEAVAEAGGEVSAEPEVVAHTPLDLAADARYRATGKRKSAVARVILKPGEGTYSVNGRHLDEYFPRVRLQRLARQPLEATGNQTRMDVVARIHGGGVAAQAGALRHGIARALVEADPGPAHRAQAPRLPHARPAREGAQEGRAQEGPQAAAVLQALGPAWAAAA